MPDNPPALARLWSTDLAASTTFPPIIVAELSGNHNHSLDRALALVDAAADAGADAVKLQTYTADTITLDVDTEDFVVRKPGSVWDGRRLHSLYDEAHLPWAWHAALAERALARGMFWFSSPFDATAVDFLETLQPACHKIASPEIIDLPLIRKAAATGRPLIMSTGMASLPEIGEAVAAARSAGCQQLMLLKCTTDYPAQPEHANVRTIPHLAQAFGCPAGFSDHTLSSSAAIAATAVGAVLIEKHLTLARADGGPDAHFSLEPAELKALVSGCREAAAALGRVSYGASEAERGYTRGRRSLYITQDLAAGSVLTADNLRSVRPGFGLPPRYLELCLGKRVRCDVRAGTALAWDLLMQS